MTGPADPATAVERFDCPMCSARAEVDAFLGRATPMVAQHALRLGA
ncbi:hypothetical protein [Nonomuraea sp. NPDC049709]